jgi:hypothetical protein
MTEAEWLACEDPHPMIAALGAAPTRKLLLFGAACCRRVSHLLSDSRAADALALAERFADGVAGRAELAAAQPLVSAAAEDAFSERYFAEADANFCTHPAYSAAEAAEAAVYAVAALFDQAAGGPAAIAGGSPMAADRTPHESAVLAAYRHAEAFIVWAYNPRPGGKQRSPSYKVAAVLGKRVWWSEAESQASVLRDIFGNPFRPVAFSTAWRTDTAVALARQMYEAREFGAMPILADALQDAGCDSDAILDHCRGPGPHVRGCWVVDLVLGKG